MSLHTLLVALVAPVALVALFVAPAHAQPAPPEPRGVLVVKTRALPSERDPATLPAPRALALLRSAGLRGVRAPFTRGASSLMGADRHGLRRIFEVRFDPTIDARTLAARLEATGEIEYAEPLPVRALATVAPNDTLYDAQYALKLIEAEGAWAVTRGDSSVVIGIVDTGLDWEHEDLAASIWTNPNEIAGNGVDDDANGYVDDVRGWDFVGDVTMQEVAQGIFREDNDPKVRADISPGDIRNHGTHVGGIVAASGNNGRGIAGVAYGCRLMPIKTSSDVGASYIFRGYEAVLYCARNGADVVNCSWGGRTVSRLEADVMAEAIDLGCIVVCAAGNNGFNLNTLDFYPAMLPGIVSVGASDRNEGEAYFSNRGVTTTVFAPGVDVLSTVAGNEYSSKSGTSMAAPVVAGVAALVRSVHPDWTSSMVLSQLRSTSDSVLRGSSRGRADIYGRVNARRAVTENTAGARAVPGVILARTRWLDGQGDTVRTTSSRRIGFTLRNNLGTARALSVAIAPLDPQIQVVAGATTTLDSLAAGGEIEVAVDIAVAPGTIWFAGSYALRLGLADTAGYADYLIAQIPFALAAPTRAVDLTLRVGEIEPFDVDSPSPDVAWISAEQIDGSVVVLRIAADSISRSTVDLGGPLRVRAIDSLRCFVNAGAGFGATSDGGVTWRYWRADTAVRAVDQFVLFSETDWFLCERMSYQTFTIPYAFSSDAGATWRRDTIRLDSARAAGGFLFESARFGSMGILTFGTAGILRTSDAGRTWMLVDVDSTITVSRIALWSVTDGMLLASSSGGTRMATTTDGGATWTLAPDPVAVPDAIGKLTTPEGSQVSYIVGRTGSIQAVDAAGSRRQIPSIRLRTRFDDAVASASDSLVRIWHVGPVFGHIDIPLTTSGAATPEAARGLDLTVRPIPARDELSVSIASKGDVSLEVIDLLGRTLMTRTLDGSSERHTLPIATLAPGRYLLIARDGARSSAVAFVVR